MRLGRTDCERSRFHLHPFHHIRKANKCADSHSLDTYGKCMIQFNCSRLLSAVSYIVAHSSQRWMRESLIKCMVFVYRWTRSERKASNEPVIVTVPHRRRPSRLCFWCFVAANVDIFCFVYFLLLFLWIRSIAVSWNEFLINEFTGHFSVWKSFRVWRIKCRAIWIYSCVWFTIPNSRIRWTPPRSYWTNKAPNMNDWR